jgi:GNAT superfamily N-acetyltransferase
VISAIEQMFGECFRSFAVLPNARVLDDATRVGVITKVPMTFFNGVAVTRSCDVAATIDVFRAAGRPFRWWISPSTEPPDLPRTLLAHGMRQVFDSGGMHADLTRMPVVTSPLTIRRVEDEAALRTFSHVLMTGFEKPPSATALWFDAYRHCGLDGPWVHFVGSVDEEPVATSSVLLCGPLAGIYHVVTLPAYRGRGFGAAITLAAMQYARDLGAREAVLQSSAMGASVYRGIGFTEYCRLGMWEGGAAPPA